MALLVVCELWNGDFYCRESVNGDFNCRESVNGDFKTPLSPPLTTFKRMETFNTKDLGRVLRVFKLACLTMSVGLNTF